MLTKNIFNWIILLTFIIYYPIMMWVTYVPQFIPQGAGEEEIRTRADVCASSTDYKSVSFCPFWHIPSPFLEKRLCSLYSWLIIARMFSGNKYTGRAQTE